MENHERPVAEVGVNARWAAPAGLTTLGVVRLHAMPPLVPSSVQDDLDILIFCEIPSQMIPKARLVSGDDEQAPDRAAHGRDSGPPPGACQAGADLPSAIFSLDKVREDSIEGFGVQESYLRAPGSGSA